MPRVVQQRERLFQKGVLPQLVKALHINIRLTELFLNYLYICAGVLFTIGSVLFYPGLGAQSYRFGVWSYFVGGIIYLKVSLFDLEEAYHAHVRFDVAMNYMYVIGTTAYLFGTIIYLPIVRENMGEIVSSVIGAIGFILGSIFFNFACFLNGAHSSDAFAHSESSVRLAEKVLILATTYSTLLGSLLFLVGSVLYMPIIGCNKMTEVIGTTLYLLGSVFFTIAGILPVLRIQLCPRAKGPTTLIESTDQRISSFKKKQDDENLKSRSSRASGSTEDFNKSEVVSITAEEQP